MEISDQELRGLVRDAIARHGRTPAAGPGPAGPPGHVVHVSSGISASHGRFLLAAGSAAGEDGQCLIEPAVRCNHCGYCQSLGH